MPSRSPPYRRIHTFDIAKGSVKGKGGGKAEGKESGRERNTNNATAHTLHEGNSIREKR